MLKQCAIDFEFDRPADKDMGLLCAATHTIEHGTQTFWLLDPKGKLAFAQYVAKLIKEDYVFVGYVIELAEARCIAAMGADPNMMKWRDIFLEWRWLRNHDDRYRYGKLMSNNFPQLSVPPKVHISKKASKQEEEDAKEENEEYLQDLCDEEGLSRSQLCLKELDWGLLDCCYAFDVIGVTEYREAIEEKKFIRDEIIINGGRDKILKYKDDILKYCASDVSDLLSLADAMHHAMVKVGMEDHIMFTPGGGYVDKCLSRSEIKDLQLSIGSWGARLGKYGNRGIPLNAKRFERLLEITPMLQEKTKAEWNLNHPTQPLYRVGLADKMLASRKTMAKSSPYLKNKMTKDSEFLASIIEQYAKETGIDWPKTKTGKYDTGKKVLARYAAGENIIKQLERHNGQMSTLKTYSPNKNGHVEARDYVGSDYHQRPSFGPLGTQTARNAAKAKSYCFLGPHWLRAMVDPPEGKAIVELDYGSEEVFIAAALSGDENMMKAYASNDVYMYYAQLTGMYPADLPIPTEEERGEEWFKPYKKIRNISKTLNLSMQFGAGASSVAGAVRDATRNPVTGEVDESIDKDKGKEWIEDYQDAYPEYVELREDLIREYKSGMPLILQNGWRLGASNPSPLSVANLPIQGTGSVILQRLCELADEAGLVIIATLHDAVTLICDDADAEAVAEKGREVMLQAAKEILGIDGMKVGAPEIIRHGDLWLHSDRAKSAWEGLKEYFND